MIDATPEIHPERIHYLNGKEALRGRYVLYWMQQAQRASWNHALEYAIQNANALQLPLVTVFGLTSHYPEANLRHYAFLLEGLAETAKDLERRGIRFLLLKGDPPEVALRTATDAAVVVCDGGYLRHQRQWRQRVAETAPCRVVEVESDVVVPVTSASGKAEVAARTFRPRMQRRLEEFLAELLPSPLERDSLDLMKGEGIDPSDREILKSMDLERSVSALPSLFPGGSSVARRRLHSFLEDGLPHYEKGRTCPEQDAVSRLSPYLHFGQISPLEIALEVRRSHAPASDRAAFLEELLVRRELAVNFVFNAPGYDRYDALPGWARQSLDDHRQERQGGFSPETLEKARTDDPYWNAAMEEMRETGYLHNRLRMYWGKRLLAWSSSAPEAFRLMLTLNNRYFLDGRDPSSFANVAWVFGQHDRPWPERHFFGKVRSMTPSGLERKCDMATYLKKTERLLATIRTGRKS